MSDLWWEAPKVAVGRRGTSAGELEGGAPTRPALPDEMRGDQVHFQNPAAREAGSGTVQCPPHGPWGPKQRPWRERRKGKAARSKEL
jgi:hypothetical protein